MFRNNHKRYFNFKNRTSPLTCLAHMQIYWNKRKCLQKKRKWPQFHWFGTPNMAPLTLCENPLYIRLVEIC